MVLPLGCDAGLPDIRRDQGGAELCRPEVIVLGGNLGDLPEDRRLEEDACAEINGVPGELMNEVSK